MKKEFLFIFSVVLIGLAYVIDFISGRLLLPVKNPYQFLTSPLMSQYPLTTLGIFARCIGLFFLVWILLSFIQGFYFNKAIALFVIFVLSNLYAIQQLATGVRVTTVQWTISIAYASTLLLIPLVYYLIRSTATVVVKKVYPPKSVSQSDTPKTPTEDTDE